MATATATDLLNVKRFAGISAYRGFETEFGASEIYRLWDLTIPNDARLIAALMLEAMADPTMLELYRVGDVTKQRGSVTDVIKLMLARAARLRSEVAGLIAPLGTRISPFTVEF